jgi:hypothetical protein
MATPIIIPGSQVVTEFKAYYPGGSQDLKNLINKFYRTDQVTENTICTPLPINQTGLEFVDVEMDEVVQGYQDDFTEKTAVSTEGWTVVMHRQKINEKVQPSSIFYSWMGFLASMNQTPEQYPLITYLIEQHILKRQQQDMENIAYKGVKVTPTAGTPTTSLQSIDGIEKVMNDLTAGGVIAPISMGVIPLATALNGDKDFCSYVEDFAALIDKVYRGQQRYIAMSEDLKLRYRRGRRDKYNLYHAQVSDLEIVEDFPNMRIVGLPSMEGKNRLFSSTKENTIMTYSKGTPLRVGSPDHEPYRVYISKDWFKAYFFMDRHNLFRTDQN